MSRLPLSLAVAACLATLVLPAHAQLAASPGVRLAAFSLDGSGGGLASLDTAGHLALGDLSGGELVSPRYRATLGFLGANDPQVTNSPVVFGVQPAYGPREGGTQLSLTGLNFDKFGAGASLSVTVGGHIASSVLVKSSSLITLVVPAGVSGPADIVVSDSLGTGTRHAAFLYTPAVTATPVVPLGGELALRNYGPPGQEFLSLVSLTTCALPMRFGTLLVGPNFIELLSPTPYPSPDGVSEAFYTVPQDVALSGLVAHFQSLSISQLQPLQATFTNACTLTIP
jgi:hypothetical protein